MSRIWLFLSTISLLLLCSCASPPKAPHAEKSAAWFSILIDDTSDWQIRVRPKDAAQDPVFGALLRRAEREASAAIGAARIGQTTLQALEQSDVVVLAVRRAKPIDAVLVIGGVPASVAPDTMIDDRGNALWRRVDGRSRTLEEYVQTRPSGPDDPAIRLVALPGRTWVVAVGGAVDRMATAFSIAPPGAYRPEVHPPGQDLADLLVVGELLIPLKNRQNAEMLEPLLGPLSRATIRLDGGRSPAAQVVLTYRDGTSAIQAEDFVRALEQVFGTRYPKLKPLLESAAISRAGRDVKIGSAVPGGLVKMLLEAGRSESLPDAPNPADPPNPNLRPKPEHLTDPTGNTL